MSHPLRSTLVKALGVGGFQIVYSLVSFATLAWVYIAFKAAPPTDLPRSGEIGWIIATLLTLPAMILLAGSLIGNPALPTPMAQTQARAEPRGVFLVTRHPMMWGIALWALSHIVRAGNGRACAGRRVFAGREETGADGRCLGDVGTKDQLLAALGQVFVGRRGAAGRGRRVVAGRQLAAFLRGRHPGGAVAPDYSPVNTALRFSISAATPSAWSAVVCIIA
jgi:hypothetical protein